jgi:hypothetical protein
MRSLIAILFFSCFSYAWAIEISPSDTRVPDRFINPPGKRFSIFSGDPERVQKVNEINLKDFDANLEFAKNEYSLAEWKFGSDGNPVFDLTFKIKNKSKRSYILSFPDAQRYDFLIKGPKNEVVYIWSEDKTFTKDIGQTFINKNENISFKPNPEINVRKFIDKLAPGEYKVVAILSNYPEIKAERTLVIKP